MTLGYCKRVTREFKTFKRNKSINIKYHYQWFLIDLLILSEWREYCAEYEEPDWSVRQRQDDEEKNARVSLIAEEFAKRRGKSSKRKKVNCSLPTAYCDYLQQVVTTYSRL